MEEYSKILKINKELDKVFITKYGDDKEYYQKNCIALLVELGEFINETKCFKYWSIKSPIKEKVLEEYADCITMCLSFFYTFNIEIDNIPNHFDTENILLLINEIFKDTTCMFKDGNDKLAKKIFSNLVYLGKLFGYQEKEIYDACYKKMEIIKERLETDY